MTGSMENYKRFLPTPKTVENNFRLLEISRNSSCDEKTYK
jgi:hypothetical protein